MSSAEEDFNENEIASTAFPGSKKRRVQRACDTCRRKKIRCDGGQMPGNRCSNCITYSFECTYVEAAKKRGPPKGYVESLENRLEKMEKLLQKVCPDADFSHELGGGKIDRETWQHRGGVATSASGPTLTTGTAPSSSASSVYGGPPNNSNTSLENQDLVASDDEGIVTLRLSENFESMNLADAGRVDHRFFGKSSGVTLIQKAIDLKKEATGSEDFRAHFFRPLDEGYPWELAARNIEEPEYTFPEDDLGRQLVDLYFVHMDPLTPLLHRPSFERKIRQGVHLRNSTFATVYLLVCAAASRFSDDPRVFLDGVESGVLEHSAGWKFFAQVQMVRRTLLGPPCLEDLQTYCLSVLYLQGTSAPQACWTIVGIGIRLAQDVGAHRRKSYIGKLSVEGELWKRAFWVLVVFDRVMSSSLGRPCAIQDEDFDLDFPVECDDEYWEHPDPEQAFKQPPDKPSKISYFISFIKLHNILSFAHRTIYSINKSKVLLGFVGQQWEQHIVAELDSSLNKWIDEVPDHLRWDPTRDADSPFFMQSTSLYAHYYHVQICIHRPFIPSPRKPSPLSFPSLAICTNAARSCSHVIDIYRRRSKGYVPFLQIQAFMAGIVLLMNIWGGKRSGLSTDPVKEMADVHKCMSVLRACENRWHTAGRLGDILYELASVGDLPLPQPSPQGGTKRERDSDGSPTLVSQPVSPYKDDSPRAISGTRRIRETPSQSTQQQQQARQHHQQPVSPLPPPSSPSSQSAPSRSAPTSQSYSLPVYSNDLGRLPLHGQVTFGMNGAATSSGSAHPHPHAPHHPSDVWFTPLAGGASQPPPATSVPPTHHHSAASSVHAFGLGEAYSIDDLFLDSFASFSAQGPAAGHAHGHALGHDGRSQPGGAGTASELQAFIDAAAAAGGGGGGGRMQPGMMSTNEIVDVDPDTIAMWSSAPTGFGVNDWGTYLSNVSGGTGGGGHGSHGQRGQQRTS